jgi:hypothetical protein
MMRIAFKQDVRSERSAETLKEKKRARTAKVKIQG